MTTNFEICQLPPNEFRRWTDLVSGSPDGSVYSLPAYLDVLCGVTGGRFAILAVKHGAELAGGIALYERESRLGWFVMPRRLLHYNGIVLRRYDTKYPSEQTSRHLRATQVLVDAMVRRRYVNLEIVGTPSVLDVRPFGAAGWSVEPRYTYVVSVADLAGAWSRVEQNLRRLIQRCERDGMTVREESDFDAFYRLHAATMDRKELSAYLPEAAFRAYYEGLRRADLCRLYHARAADGRAVATQLVLLGPRRVSHSVAAAVDPAFVKSGVSALLRWKVFEAVAALGYEANDLTDAALGSVTHFKSQLGGDLKLHFSLRAPQALPIRGAQSVLAVYRPIRDVVRSRLGAWWSRG